MTNQEIQELKKKLNELEQKQESKPGGIGDQLEEAGKDFGSVMDKVPHIKVGRDKPQDYPEDPIIAKFKKWALIIFTILIGGGALLLVGWRILQRFI